MVADLVFIWLSHPQHFSLYYSSEVPSWAETPDQSPLSYATVEHAGSKFSLLPTRTFGPSNV